MTGGNIPRTASNSADKECSNRMQKWKEGDVLQSAHPQMQEFSVAGTFPLQPNRRFSVIDIEKLPETRNIIRPKIVGFKYEKIACFGQKP